jgi:apolipoprotein D and lipocalin family protein
VIAIDKNYQYALVSGSSLKYLWILSRTPQLPQNIKEEYLQLAHEKGFKVENLIWVEHNQQE